MKSLQIKLKGYFSHPLVVIIGGLICCLLSLCYHLSSQNKLNQLEQSARILKKRLHLVQQRKGLEQKILQQLKIADRDYIEKELESLQFLSPEIKKNQALLHSDPSHEGYKKRLEFLQSSQNHLRFREQNFQRIGRFQEVEIIQEHPVEMNQDDLKALIARVENQTIGNFQPGLNPPALLIKKFDLLKKPMNSNEEIFSVNLELIKHEMVHE